MSDLPNIAVEKIRVPAHIAPFMDRHGESAVAAIREYLSGCQTKDEQLGALGVLALVLTATGDGLARLSQ